MRVGIAYAATLLVLISGLSAPPAAAEPSPDAAPNPGVAAYDAGEYERAFEMLKPAADAGDLEARYLMARLLSGDLADEIDYERALDYLDERTRCYSPSALNLYGYTYPRAHGDGAVANRRQMLAYKEAMLAGSLKAAFNLGKTVTQDFDRPFEGASYIWEAAERGHTAAKGVVEDIRKSENAAYAERRITEIIEREPPEVRWPTLDETERLCPHFTVLQTAK